MKEKVYDVSPPPDIYRMPDGLSITCEEPLILPNQLRLFEGFVEDVGIEGRANGLLVISEM